MFLMRLTLLTVVSLLTFPAPAQADEFKTMTVDINKLYNEYHVTQSQMAVLKTEQDAFNKERMQRQKAITEVTDKLKAIILKLRDKAMPKVEKNNLTEEYEELASQYQALNKDSRESDREKLRETKEKITVVRSKGLNDIGKVIRKYAKDNGYHWVIETSGVSNTQISPLVYAKNSVDKTAELLAIINKDAPKKETENTAEDE